MFFETERSDDCINFAMMCVENWIYFVHERDQN